MFAEQIKPGENYAVFKKCVSISILDFELFEEETEFYSSFHIREDRRNFIYTDKMEFHVLELPKLPEELKEGSSDIYLWGKFISAERKEEFDMLAAQNPYIKSAYNKLQIISQDREKRMEYEAREKAILDYNQTMLEAEERGHEKGRKEGMAEGRKEGRAEGKEEGRAETIIELMSEDLKPDDEIIEKLQKRMNITKEKAADYLNQYKEGKLSSI
jgi:predicted transposase/invertase (TIGR01784 family)